MLQICKEDKLKVYDAIRSGHVDAADLSFPNLIDTGLLAPLAQVLEDKQAEL